LQGHYQGKKEAATDKTIIAATSSNTLTPASGLVLKLARFKLFPGLVPLQPATLVPELLDWLRHSVKQGVMFRGFLHRG
jgi:hypothetical protein